ncbi:MAG: DUF3105 domain-containing protein [Candidatus Doudnabacteria bacterium]|nr:DUF3105 domain-containing protein [Candidatus Doudnabacteria bacterium]
MKTIMIVSLIAAAVIGLGIVLFKYGNTKPQDIPQKGQAVELQPAAHIAVGAAHDPYNSNPPTSGPHYAEPANWGVYQQVLPDEQVIHNLEHGGIWISYKDIDSQTKDELETIGRQYYGAVVVSPRPHDDAKISLASWGRLEKLDSFNRDEIINFIKANKNKSPEKLAR